MSEEFSNLPPEFREIMAQAKKPYGSVDERYLRDWLLDTLQALDEALGKLAAVESYGVKLELKAGPGALGSPRQAVLAAVARGLAGILQVESGTREG